MRVAQGLSLRDLAARSGVSFAYLGEIERDVKQPSDRLLRSILLALAENLDQPRGVAS